MAARCVYLSGVGRKHERVIAIVGVSPSASREVCPPSLIGIHSHAHPEHPLSTWWDVVKGTEITEGPPAVIQSGLLLQGDQSHHQPLAVFQKPGEASLQFEGFCASLNFACHQITISWKLRACSGQGDLNIVYGIRQSIFPSESWLGPLRFVPDNIPLSPTEAWVSSAVGLSPLLRKACSTELFFYWFSAHLKAPAPQSPVGWTPGSVLFHVIDGKAVLGNQTAW